MQLIHQLPMLMFHHQTDVGESDLYVARHQIHYDPILEDELWDRERWLLENCVGKFEIDNQSILFTDESDAVLAFLQFA